MSMSVENITLKCKNMELNLAVTEDGAYIDGGVMNSISIVRAPITHITVKRLSDGREFSFDSESGFGRTEISKYKNHTKIALFNPLGGTVPDFCIVIQIKTIENRIEWKLSVLNDNHDYSVLSADYPSLKMTGTHIDAFIPQRSGIEEKDVIENEYEIYNSYPFGCEFTMQYFAFYTDRKGIYAGFHDRDGSFKYFSVKTCRESGICAFETRYPAVGMGNGANAFDLPGKFVWQALDGDWYDASNIYRAFVRKEAAWIPEVDEDGRFDTPKWFKEIPFWIMDWMPNGAHKKDELPTSIRPRDGVVIPPDAWYERPIRLQKELGVPIGYHLYNWHMIPFNNDFPHFFPAQDGAFEGIQKMAENQIYVMPYINGRIWDMLDGEDKDYMFGKVAKKWATKDMEGNIFTESYESLEKNGEKVKLATMCPSSGVWKTQISGVLDKLVNELKVPAIYIDQIAAAPPKACADKNHNHLPGGGSWWNEACVNMLTRFQAEVGDEVALTTECNAEPFIKEVDGCLTWLWLQTNDVPAFTRVYSGLTMLFGRNSNGKKKEDIMFFKHSMAQALVFGQQLGWINADVVDNPTKLSFLKKMVQLRVAHTKFFNSGDLLRPPVVECDVEGLEPVMTYKEMLEFRAAKTKRSENGDALCVPADGKVSDLEVVERAMSQKGSQVIHHVISGGWRLWDGSDTRIFAINLADQKVHAILHIDALEYADKACSCVLQGSGEVISVKEEGQERIVDVLIEPNDYIVL